MDTENLTLQEIANVFNVTKQAVSKWKLPSRNLLDVIHYVINKQNRKSIQQQKHEYDTFLKQLQYKVATREWIPADELADYHQEINGDIRVALENCGSALAAQLEYQPKDVIQQKVDGYLKNVCEKLVSRYLKPLST